MAKRKPGRPRKVTDQQIADALDECRGSIIQAAELLDIKQRALYYRINGNPQTVGDTPPNETLQEIVSTWKKIKIAALEDSVFERAMESDTLAIFTLKAQAGWKDGREVTIQGPGGGAVPIAVVQADDWNAI